MKNIGLTIRTIENFNDQIYSSGIDQNIMILYNYLKILSCVRFFSRDDNPESKIYECYNILNLQKLKECDYIISCGLELPANINQFIHFKNGISNTKLILCLYGSPLIYDMRDVFGDTTNNKETYDVRIYDEIWISPHFEYHIDYIKYIYHCDDIFVGPYIWEPDYIPKTLNTIITDLNIGIFEPNLFFNKSCIIPIIIADKCKNIINDCFVFCTDKLQNNSKFMKFVELTDLNKQKHIHLLGRQKFCDIMKTKCNIVVSFVDNYDLNYLFLECFYLGIPLIHNSKILKDWGYYYDGCNVLQAYQHIKNIKNNGFDKENYISKHKTILDYYSMRNPEYKDFFNKHLQLQDN